jgi:hypothetical protein
MSSQTGGGYYLLADASEIPDAILGLIGEVAIIHWLSVSPVPQDPYATWATVIPPGYEDVPPNSQRCFDVVFKVPTWAPVGNYEFDLVVDADDATEATVPVVIHRTGASPTEKTTWGQIRNMFRK